MPVSSKKPERLSSFSASEMKDNRLTAFSLLERTERLLSEGLMASWARELLNACQPAPSAANKAATVTEPATVVTSETAPPGQPDPAVSEAKSELQVERSRSIDFRRNAATLTISATELDGGLDDAVDKNPLASLSITRVQQSASGGAFRCRLGHLPANRWHSTLLVINEVRDLGEAAINLAEMASRHFGMMLDLSEIRQREEMERAANAAFGALGSRGRRGGRADACDQASLNAAFADMGVEPVGEMDAEDAEAAFEEEDEGPHAGSLDSIMDWMGIHEIDAAGNRIEKAAPVESAEPAAAAAAESTAAPDAAADDPSEAAESSTDAAGGTLDPDEIANLVAEANTEAEEPAPEQPAVEAAETPVDAESDTAADGEANLESSDDTDTPEKAADS
ncbi:MAG: hypothetical protein ACFBZ8_07655 [Opitutales bacterium]